MKRVTAFVVGFASHRPRYFGKVFTSIVTQGLGRGSEIVKYFDFSGKKDFDFRYYVEKGWLESDYFYPTRLGPVKKTAGYLFDRMTPTIRKRFV